MYNFMCNGKTMRDDEKLKLVEELLWHCFRGSVDALVEGIGGMSIQPTVPLVTMMSSLLGRPDIKQQKKQYSTPVRRGNTLAIPPHIQRVKQESYFSTPLGSYDIGKNSMEKTSVYQYIKQLADVIGEQQSRMRDHTLEGHAELLSNQENRLREIAADENHSLEKLALSKKYFNDELEFYNRTFKTLEQKTKTLERSKIQGFLSDNEGYVNKKLGLLYRMSFEYLTPARLQKLIKAHFQGESASNNESVVVNLTPLDHKDDIDSVGVFRMLVRLLLQRQEDRYLEKRKVEDEEAQRREANKREVRTEEPANKKDEKKTPIDKRSIMIQHGAYCPFFSVMRLLFSSDIYDDLNDWTKRLLHIFTSIPIDEPKKGLDANHELEELSLANASAFDIMRTFMLFNFKDSKLLFAEGFRQEFTEKGYIYTYAENDEEKWTLPPATLPAINQYDYFLAEYELKNVLPETVKVEQYIENAVAMITSNNQNGMRLGLCGVILNFSYNIDGERGKHYISRVNIDDKNEWFDSEQPKHGSLSKILKGYKQIEYNGYICLFKNSVIS
jgi:hypothetical protein